MKTIVKKDVSSIHFKTPAKIQDFQNDPAKQAKMDALWNSNLNGFTEQGMLSNRWNTTNTPSTTNYYNPTSDTSQSTLAQILWSPFPGRLAFNFPSLSQSQLNQLADTGNMPDTISNDPCDPPSGTAVPYFPYGPRGWLDEYCEWAVTRNTAGKITKVQFTCENPEYWNSVWQVDPNKVLDLYRSIIGNPNITLEDLSVPGVTDPITGQPVYNPLNKWNTGTSSTATGGGAIHLTSTPNTLQTEIGLATLATVLRNNPSGTTGNTVWPSSQYNALLCDAQYGQKNRNSDPNIGGAVNSFVNSAFKVTLANPPGLYIQLPDFSTYQTPDHSDASQYWTIVRGQRTLTDDFGQPMPGNFILHAVYEVPSSKNFVVGDITIAGQPIDWGSQIASTFKMHIVAAALQSTKPQGYDAVGDTTPSQTFAQPEQLFYGDYFNAVYPISVPNPVNNPISLLSNSTYVPAKLNVGTTAARMVVTAATCTAVAGQPNTYPTISFDDPNITGVVTSVQENVFYAVPGNSNPSNSTAIFVTVSVNQNTTPGPKSLFVTNAGQSQSSAMPALLMVTPVTVQADIAWQSSGVVIASGQCASISYVNGGGQWTANPNTNGGRLYDANGNPHFTAGKPGYTLPGADGGALIGKVGTTTFLIGNNADVPDGLTGELFLCINDDLEGIYGAGLTDNIGHITVQITVS